MSILETLSERLCAIKYETLPVETIALAEACLFDLIGVIYGAVDNSASRALLRYASSVGGSGQSPIWGTGTQTSQAEAAMINGAMGYMLEFDDGISLGGHWSSSSIPVILALAEQSGATHKDVITAIVVAAEAGTRISRAFSNELLEKGIHFPGFMAPIAGAAGAAHILGASVEQMAGAIGHACLNPVAPYVAAHSGADSKNLYSGWGNLTGYHYARLACAGFLGPADLLEGKDSLAKGLGWRGNAAELRNVIVETEYNPFALHQTYFKKFPCCRWIHAPAQAVLDLRRSAAHDQAKEIVVRGPAFMEMYAGKFDPNAGATSAKYNLSYCCAAAWILGDLQQDAFEMSIMRRDDIAALASKVSFEIDPELEAEFPPLFLTDVQVSCGNDQEYTARRGLPWSATEPPRREELQEKFEKLMRTACDDELAESWVAYFEASLSNDPTLAGLYVLLRQATKLSSFN